MNINFLVVGKTENSYLKEGITEYIQRIGRYINFEKTELIVKGNTTEQKVVLQLESAKILQNLKNTDFVVLLDERGEQLSSDKFSKKLEDLQNKGISRLVFICGGAYGFGEEVYERANLKMSLSMMTYTHQMVRLIFLEQLYRAYTIMKNEKYHH